MSLRVERSETKQSQGLGLLRFARNDGKYFCLPTYVREEVKTAQLRILYHNLSNYEKKHPANRPVTRCK
ncbi:hypothetical protein NIES267_01400 [Calothrix parasitica NIES-267]|uniref:Uncharacterized protein n=1 Tax=Calothrix parasitica NIES-267 TaxID=1973488 RepID=A0A1Z4LHH0_9CYAN|nr:hypothetical protein NIES267_01400 [Calothrix parasitica NIES-267]